MRRARIRLQRRADLEARHVGHHHVEENEVHPLAERHFERVAAVQRDAHVEIFGLQARLQKAGVGSDVIDDKDARCHFVRLPGLCFADIGFDGLDERRDGDRL